MIDLGATLVASDEVLFRNLDGEAVLVHLGSGECFELDRAGTEVWERIGRGETLAMIVAAMSPADEASRAAAERDLLAFVAALVDRRLVHARPKPS